MTATVAAAEFPRPVFIITCMRSYSSLVCGMLGQHPRRHAYLLYYRGGCARTVLRNVFVNFGDVGAGTRRVP